MKEYKNTNAWQDSVKLTTALSRLTASFKSTQDTINPEEDFIFRLKENLVLIPTKIAFAHQQTTLSQFMDSMSMALYYLDDVKKLLKRAHKEGFISLQLLQNISKEIDCVYRSVQKTTSLAIYILPM